MTVHTTPTEKSLMAEIERLAMDRNAHLQRAERACVERDRLRAALQKIADHDYTEADWKITGSRPDTIWEAVARAALRSSNEQ